MTLQVFLNIVSFLLLFTGTISIMLSCLQPFHGLRCKLQVDPCIVLVATIASSLWFTMSNMQACRSYVIPVCLTA